MVTLENIDLNLLLVLHHVLACGSVSGAAARLHVTAPAVSNSLARLRELLGDPLLVRRGRGLTPTPRAQALATRLTAVIGELRLAVEGERRFEPATSTRRFTLASADNLGSSVLPALVRSFARALPLATLNVVSLDAAVAQDGLASGEVDLLLGLPPEAPDLRSEPAYSERLLCAGHRATSRPRALTLERFLAHRHVAVLLGGVYPIDWIDLELAKLGKRRSIALTVPQFATAAACLVGTPWLAMLPERMARQLATAFELTLWPPPVPLPRVQLRQVWHTRTDADEGSRFLRRLVQRSLQNSVR